jgi:hypothetical protein
MTQRQDTMLRACSIFTNMSYTVATSLVGFTTSFAAAQGKQPPIRSVRPLIGVQIAIVLNEKHSVNLLS